MQKSLPAQPSLEQFKKQAKELVKNHRNHDADAFALIREFLPSLTGKSDEEIVLFPFALHDAQSVIARQYGFISWNQLRDHVEASLNRLRPESSVEQKFKTICRSKELGDYELFCSVMDEAMRLALSREKFEGTLMKPYFKAKYTVTYMGEMIQREHTIHFWRLSAPGLTDILARMGVRDDLVSGILWTAPFGGA